MVECLLCWDEAQGCPRGSIQGVCATCKNIIKSPGRVGWNEEFFLTKGLLETLTASVGKVDNGDSCLQQKCQHPYFITVKNLKGKQPFGVKIPVLSAADVVGLDDYQYRQTCILDDEVRKACLPDIPALERADGIGDGGELNDPLLALKYLALLCPLAVETIPGSSACVRARMVNLCFWVLGRLSTLLFNHYAELKDLIPEEQLPDGKMDDLTIVFVGLRETYRGLQDNVIKTMIDHPPFKTAFLARLGAWIDKLHPYAADTCLSKGRHWFAGIGDKNIDSLRLRSWRSVIQVELHHCPREHDMRHGSSYDGSRSRLSSTSAVSYNPSFTGSYMGSSSINNSQTTPATERTRGVFSGHGDWAAHTPVRTKAVDDLRGLGLEIIQDASPLPRDGFGLDAHDIQLPRVAVIGPDGITSDGRNPMFEYSLSHDLSQIMAQSDQPAYVTSPTIPTSPVTYPGARNWHENRLGPGFSPDPSRLQVPGLQIRSEHLVAAQLSNRPWDPLAYNNTNTQAQILPVHMHHNTLFPPNLPLPQSPFPPPPPSPSLSSPTPTNTSTATARPAPSVPKTTNGHGTEGASKMLSPITTHMNAIAVPPSASSSSSALSPSSAAVESLRNTSGYGAASTVQDAHPRKRRPSSALKRAGSRGGSGGGGGPRRGGKGKRGGRGGGFGGAGGVSDVYSLGAGGGVGGGGAAGTGG